MKSRIATIFLVLIAFALALSTVSARPQDQAGSNVGVALGLWIRNASAAGWRAGGWKRRCAG